jgi:hypothetical protein
MIAGCLTGRRGNVDAPTQNHLLFLFWSNHAKVGSRMWVFHKVSRTCPQVPHVPNCGTLLDTAQWRAWRQALTLGVIICRTLLDFAGHCDRPIAHDQLLHDSTKKVGYFVEIGGRHPPSPLPPELDSTAVYTYRNTYSGLLVTTFIFWYQFKITTHQPWDLRR